MSAMPKRAVVLRRLGTFPEPLIAWLEKRLGRGRLAKPGMLAMAMGLSLVTARLAVDGNWRLALGVVGAIPAVILIQRYPVSALIIWILMTPFLVAVHTAADRQIYWAIHRGLPVAMVLLVAVNAMLRVHRRRLPGLGPAEFAMAGYVVVSVAHIVLLGRDPLAKLYVFYDQVVVPMCLYLLIRLLAPSGVKIDGEAQPSGRGLGTMAPIAFFVVVSQFGIGILSWVAPQVLPKPWLGLAGQRTTGSLRSAPVYSIVMVFFGLLLLQAAMARPRGWVRSAFISAFVLSWIGVALTFSRGSWLGGGIVTLALACLYPKVVLRLLLVAAIIVLPLAAGPLAGVVSFADQRLNAADAALSRLPVYYAAVRMFAEKPVFGWGYGDFNEFDRQFQGRVGDLVNPEKDHSSHNKYLTILAEQGLVGLVLFLAPAVWWLLGSLKAWRALPREGFWSSKLLLVLWLAILHYLVVNMFSDVSVVFALGIWWLALGLIGHMVSSTLASAPRRALAGGPRRMSRP